MAKCQFHEWCTVFKLLLKQDEVNLTLGEDL